jgi:hypothetical protein
MILEVIGMGKNLVRCETISNVNLNGLLKCVTKKIMGRQIKVEKS